MNRIFNLVFFFLVISTTIFFARNFEDIKSAPIPFVGQHSQPFYREEIAIWAKAYTAKESKLYLDRNLLRWGVQPLQVTIQNNTGLAYSLSYNSIDLPSVTSNEVAGRVLRSAIPRSIAFKVAGFFFWPIMIPGAIDSFMTAKTHFIMRKDYYAKSIKNQPELIVPYSTVNRIIFVSADEDINEFILYLHEPKSGGYYSALVEIQG